jgi:hypothetical protein
VSTKKPGFGRGVSGENQQKRTRGQFSKRKGARNARTRVCARLALLSQSVAKAVETLVGLLDAGDGRLKRLAAKDILDQPGKFRELDDLTHRIEAIEDRLETRK